MPSIIRAQLKRHNLCFETELEIAFSADYYAKSLNIIRVALVLGIILYASFGVLDIYIVPISIQYIWLIRFAIVCPVLIIVFLLTFTDIYRRFMQLILAAVSLVTGLGIVAMITIAVEKESTLYYYAGLLLVIMWVYTMIRLRLLYAIIVCWTVVIAYEASAIFSQKMLMSPELVTGFINNNFFFISANVIGMFVNYHMERYTRSDFMQRRMIDDTRRDLEAEKDELKKRDLKIQKELTMARTIQQELIPDKSPVDYIATFYKPMEAVGGDIFDFLSLGEGKMGIFIGDVSGHGVPAALITSMVKSILKEGQRYTANPASMLMHLNEVLYNQIADNFMTAIYGVYQPSSNELVFANAAHNPPFILVDKQIKKMELREYTGMPIAITGNDSLIGSKQHYRNVSIKLPKNSTLLLYTDGLVEAKKIDDREATFENVVAQELQNLSTFRNHVFIEKLYSRLVAFRGIDTFDDDISIIALDVQ
ncbi:MAG: PP2C family protein-serine/threonine phosphatase [Spirochaetota bacterium]